MSYASNLIEFPVQGAHAAHVALSRELLEAIAFAGDAATGMGRVVDRVRLDERAVLAGGNPIGWVSLARELQRDLARVETVPQIVEIVINERLMRD